MTDKKTDEMTPYWRTGKKTVFEIGGEKIELIQIGPAQKIQLAKLRAFLSGPLKEIIEALPEQAQTDFFEGRMGSLVELFPILAEFVNPELWQLLGEILTAKSSEFVDKNFDIGWIFEAAEVVYKYNYGIRRIVEGFFSK